MNTLGVDCPNCSSPQQPLAVGRHFAIENLAQSRVCAACGNRFPVLHGLRAGSPDTFDATELAKDIYEALRPHTPADRLRALYAEMVAKREQTVDERLKDAGLVALLPRMQGLSLEAKIAVLGIIVMILQTLISLADEGTVTVENLDIRIEQVIEAPQLLEPETIETPVDTD